MMVESEPWDHAGQIGVLIKQERKKLGMTMTELASATGLSQSAISMIENGLRQASPQTLAKIESALQIKLPEEGGAAESPRKTNRTLKVETLGFALSLEIASFASDIQDEGINRAVSEALAVELERVLQEAETRERLTSVVKDVLKAELDRKRNEMDQLYGKIEK